MTLLAFVLLIAGIAAGAVVAAALADLHDGGV